MWYPRAEDGLRDEAGDNRKQDAQSCIGSTTLGAGDDESKDSHQDGQGPPPI